VQSHCRTGLQQNNTPFVQGHIISPLVISCFAIGNIHICRQVAIIIEQGVQFDCSFGCFVLSPIKQGKAQADCGRIQKKDLGLDPELYLLEPCLLSQTFQQYEIIGFEDVEIPVLVLIAHTGFRGCFPDAQMIEIACG